MIGIYKIENLNNGNIYIGQSIDINKRIHQHFSECYKQNRGDYNYPLHKAIRKYGPDSFNTQIIEKCSSDLLDEREIFWISYYDSFLHGYNQTPGGKSLRGEFHPLAKLNKGEVEEIRTRWAECNISSRLLYLDYKNRIGKSGFKKIISWQTWQDILPELNTKERREWHSNDKNNYVNNRIHNTGSLRYLTDTDVHLIKQLKNDDNNPYSIYINYDFNKKIGYDGFKDVWYGRSYKNIV